MVLLKQGKTKTIEEVRQQYKNFPAFIITPFSDVDGNKYCNVMKTFNSDCYSWILPVPISVYEKIGKPRFTGQDVIDNY